MIVHQHHCMAFEYVNMDQMNTYYQLQQIERGGWKFAGWIGSALDYSHRNNVVHRGISITFPLCSQSWYVSCVDLKIKSILITDGEHQDNWFWIIKLYQPNLQSLRVSVFCRSWAAACVSLLQSVIWWSEHACFAVSQEAGTPLACWEHAGFSIQPSNGAYAISSLFFLFNHHIPLLEYPRTPSILPLICLSPTLHSLVYWFLCLLICSSPNIMRFH